jgi:RHS repeat-associated protein
VTNHLGNVLATVSDRKLATDAYSYTAWTTGNTKYAYDALRNMYYQDAAGTYKRTTSSSDLKADYYTADVLSYSDYYAFGAEMPGRSFVSSGYRYGFNGQEKDGEVGEGIYTAEFWEYDSRLGRRWNTDPKDNPSISVYACFANNPIWFTDVNGDTTEIYGMDGVHLETINDGTGLSYMKVNAATYWQHKTNVYNTERAAGRNFFRYLNDPEYAAQWLSGFRSSCDWSAQRRGVNVNTLYVLSDGLALNITGNTLPSSDVTQANPNGDDCNPNLQDNYCEGTMTVSVHFTDNSTLLLGTYDVRSGPWGFGPTPNGTYTITGYKPTAENGMVCGRGTGDQLVSCQS